MTTEDIATKNYTNELRTEERADLFKRFRKTAFFIKLTNWEYWPMSLTNLPLLFIWLWFAIRARDLFFFSAVNPVIETGGLWGESKFNILKRIPSSHVPATAFIKKGSKPEKVLDKMEELSLTFPVIAKPDVGERGMLVAKINNPKELSDYLSAYSIDFLIQEFVDLPLELSVMHHRFPGQKKGAVTSVCIKETLKVTGNGGSTVRELMSLNPRAKLQLPRFSREAKGLLSHIPAAGEVLELEPIGNHCRGTMFLNGNYLIDKAWTKAFNKVARKMDDIYYGRFDLKCSSVEDLRAGRGFMVMEYNGIGAEPAHIYDPAIPVWKKYRDLYHHWRIIYRIYKVQQKKGLRGMRLSEVIHRLQVYLEYKKSIQREGQS